jgi:hypothetical protein
MTTSKGAPSRRRSPFRAAALAILTVAATAFAHGTEHVTATIAVPATLDGALEIDCSNSPGPTVTLGGDLAFAGIDAVAIFRNNQKGTHEYTATTTFDGTLLPSGETITIPKQPSRGGVGGNPFIWIQFLDGDGDALTGEIYLGRCVQGLNSFALAEAFAVGAVANVDAAIDCSNNPGPFITFSGGMSLNGLAARVIFRNNDNPVGGPHKADAVVERTLVADGTTIKFPKQPSLGGVGGNPWIWMQLLASDGTALTDEIALGRCVQSSK